MTEEVGGRCPPYGTVCEIIRMPDEPPQEIPPHHSPVRSLWAQAHGQPYVAWPDLREGRRDTDSVMVMEADSGGQILATCPVRHIAANEAILNQLLCDLESITWGGGDLAEASQPSEAAIRYEDLAIGCGVVGGMGGGAVVDGLWVHDEVAELGLAGSIEAVLRGASERIALPLVSSLRPFLSIPAAKQVPGARLLFTGLGEDWGNAFLSCDAGRITCGEGALAELLHDLRLVTRGPANQVKRSRFFRLNIDVGRYEMIEGGIRHYLSSGGLMGLYVSPTGLGIHPRLRSDGPRPAMWIDGRLERAGLIHQVCDVLEGRSPRIHVEGSRSR